MYDSPITKYYYFNGRRIAMRKDGVLTYLHGDHLDSTILATNLSGGIVSDQDYYAYGNYRRGGTLPTDHKFTDQKLDGTGLYYYNSRYYDPALGAFISPDTIVPDATNLLDYNRYMFVRGNPLKFSDPTGHCATLEDGSPDIDGDQGCWDAADEWRKTFGRNGYETVDDWQRQFAGQTAMTEDVFRTVLHEYWAPQYQAMGVYHQRYNPPPQMHPVTAQDQASEQFHAKYAPENVTLDPAALGVATLKAGTVIGPMWQTSGMAACATGVACPAGAAFVTAGKIYEGIGMATIVVDDVILPAWNGNYTEAGLNASQEGVTAIMESKLPASKPYLNWGGVYLDVNDAVCVGSDC